MNIFKRIFGLFRRAEESAVASTVPSSIINQHPRVSRRTVAINWQEMLDGNARISGYILRPSSLVSCAEISGAELLNAIEAERIAQLLERRKVIVPITIEQWRAADFSRLATANTYFLLSSNSPLSLPVSVLHEVASDICAAGCGVALNLNLFLAASDPNPVIRCLLLDFRSASLANFEKQLRDVRKTSPALLLVVEGVSTWTEYRWLMSLGASLCVGPFATTRDETEQTDRISQSRLVVIDMLNTLRSEREITEVAAVAKRDPAVVLKLLEMANSPLSGLSRRVASIEDAILLLGNDALYRWLSLAMFRIDARDARNETLMVIALSRAAFLESLAPASDRQMSDELFLLGLFSLIESLLSLPMVKVLEKMHLPGQVSAALLNSEGPYARYLMLAFAMEHCNIDQAFSLCSAIGVDPTKMLNSYSESMAWATSDMLE